MDLYVVRHGQTAWNVMKKVQGQVDIPLNDEGIKQAQRLQKEILKIEPEIVISSPLLRARKTAEILCEGKNIFVDDRITERNFGEFEGLTIKQFNADDFWSYKNNIRYKQAENIQDFFGRVYDFLKELEIKYKDKKVLLVVHTGVIIAINSYFKGIPEDDNFFKLDFKNCRVFEYNKSDII